MTSAADKIEALKLEGNALFQQGKHAAAYEKYTEALNEKPDDARVLSILYANRSACSMNLNKFLDALYDGQEAIQADEKYLKGYLRTATAADGLDMFELSAHTWAAAAEVTTDAKEKRTYLQRKADKERALTAHRDAFEKANVVRMMRGDEQYRMPAMRAMRALNMGMLKPDSSGQVILQAHTEYTQGLDILRRLRIFKDAQGVDMFETAGKALQGLTNGLITDSRAFYALGGDFLEKLTYQTRSEVRAANGWLGATARDIMEDVPRRLQTSSWDDVRPAIATTLRGWIMRGFFDSNFQQFSTSEEFYKRVVDVIEWGQRTYLNVPRQDRGSIFEPTILRGIRRLRLQNLLGLYRTKGIQSGFSIDEIGELALELKNETEASVPPDQFNGFGFYPAYFVYPKAEALAVLAWCEMHRGIEIMTTQRGDVALDKAKPHFIKSAELYAQSAATYPADDEQHLDMLTVALDAHWRAHAPLSVTIPLAREIRAALSRVSILWELKISQGVRAKVKEAGVFLRDCETRMMGGKARWSGETVYAPAHYHKYEVGTGTESDDETDDSED